MDLKIIKIASDTNFAKKLNIFTHKGVKKNTLCGDFIIIKLFVKNKIIKDIGYESESCIYCQAAASLLCKHLINNRLSNINKILNSIEEFYNNENFVIKNKLNKLYNKKNFKRKECIFLPVRAISQAIKK